jgi:GNAT superfamily N-acetyltransferase
VPTYPARAGASARRLGFQGHSASRAAGDGAHGEETLTMGFHCYRAATPDVPAVIGLVEQLYAEISHDLPADRVVAGAHAFVALDRAFALLAVDEAGPPVGLLTLIECSAIYAGGSFGTIQELYVQSDVRDRGIGHVLLEEAKRIGRARGWSRLEVTATLERVLPRSVEFYRRNDFDDSGPRLKLHLT